VRTSSSSSAAIKEETGERQDRSRTITFSIEQV
jgi:hypothetical protein